MLTKQAKTKWKVRGGSKYLTHTELFLISDGESTAFEPACLPQCEMHFFSFFIQSRLILLKSNLSSAAELEISSP